MDRDFINFILIILITTSLLKLKFAQHFNIQNRKRIINIFNRNSHPRLYIPVIRPRNVSRNVPSAETKKKRKRKRKWKEKHKDKEHGTHLEEKFRVWSRTLSLKNSPAIERQDYPFRIDRGNVSF